MPKRRVRCAQEEGEVCPRGGRGVANGRVRCGQWEGEVCSRGG